MLVLPEINRFHHMRTVQSQMMTTRLHSPQTHAFQDGAVSLLVVKGFYGVIVV